MNIQDRIRKYEKEALSKVLNGNNPDGDIGKMYIPHEYSVQLHKAIVQDMLQHLAAHALSGSPAMDVYVQWVEMYEGRTIDKGATPTPPNINDYDF